MDLQRRIADSIMFPYYEEDIRFAILSLDGVGATAYGDCSVVLQDVAISDRATVFEENSVSFCERLGLGVSQLLPPGYRSTWEDRGMLATAKLEPKFVAGTTAPEFSEILFGTTGQDLAIHHLTEQACAALWKNTSLPMVLTNESLSPLKHWTF
jgi:hypothetical protein